VAKFWLHKSLNNEEMNGQIILLLNTVVEQNYFQYNDQFFKLAKGTAMGSPISGTIAEIYLQHTENEYIKQWLDSKEICYYKCYVDDIILYNQNKTQAEQILHNINRIDENLQYKITTKEHRSINFLDLTIHRKENNIDISIYSKATNTDTTIHYLSNHPFEQKIAAFRYINRMITLSISQANRNMEWATIISTAKNNGFPENIIRNLRTKLALKKQKQKPTTKELNQKWVPFTFFGPAIRRIINLFKGSNIKIAFRTTNMIHKQLSKEPFNIQNPSGIYKLKCNTCNKIYVGQSGRAIDIRYKEQIRYVRTNNPQSAYAIHILQNRHEYGPSNNTLQLLKACTKGMRMNCWEAMYIQKFHQKE